MDKKIKKVAKVSERRQARRSRSRRQRGLGAGRLIRADLLGIRVATDREKKQLAEKGK